MNKEKGAIPIALLIQIFIVSLIIATILIGAHVILVGIAGAFDWAPSWIPFVGGAGDADQIIPAIVAGVVELMQGLVEWSLKGEFVNKGVTEMAQIVGWTWIRDLANIFIVLGLILIALGIILGIREYEAKKALPILIIIALLINFTPVICGWIVDFSNYLISHLISGGGPTGEGFVTEVLNSLSDKSIQTEVTYIFILFYFAIIAIIVYFFYFLLFLIRYLYLLILVIFSPFAFASRVFGPSEKIKKFFPGFLYWDNWWNTFLEWCTVGILGAFFIFVSNNLMAQLPTVTGPDISFIGKVIVYFFPILLLLLGFFASLEAAKAAMGMIAGMSTVLGLAAAGALKGVKFAGTKVGEAIPEKTRKWGEKQARYLPKWTQAGKGEIGPVAWTKRRGAQIGQAVLYPAIAFRRGVGKAVSAPAESQLRGTMQTAAELRGKSAQEKGRVFMTALTRQERVGALTAMIQDHDKDDFVGRLDKKERKKFDEKVKKEMGESAFIGRDAFIPIARAFPHIVDETVGKLSPEIRKDMLLPESEEKLKELGFVDKETGRGSWAKHIISGMKEDQPADMVTESILETREEAERREELGKEKGIEEKKKEGEEKVAEEKRGTEALEKRAENLETEIEKKTEAGEDTSKENAELYKINERIKKKKQGLKQIMDQIDKDVKSLIDEVEKQLDKEFPIRKTRRAIWDQIMESWGGGHLQSMFSTFKKPGIDMYMKTAKEEKGMPWMVTHNPMAALYLTSISAPALGLLAPEKITLEHVANWIEKFNQFGPQEMKKFKDTLEEIKINERRLLSEFLKIDPERVLELRDVKTGQDIINKLNKWKTEEEEKKKSE